MPFLKEIIVHPHDLQHILEQLSTQAWSQGPVIIRDTGDQITVRDLSEHYITSVKKTFCEKPG